MDIHEAMEPMFNHTIVPTQTLPCVITTLTTETQTLTLALLEPISITTTRLRNTTEALETPVMARTHIKRQVFTDAKRLIVSYSFSS